MAMTGDRGRILVVAPAWVGDAVMAEPLLRQLSLRDGGTPVDVLAAPWIRGVVARMPGVSRIIDNPFGHGQLRLRARWALGRRLAEDAYAQVLVLPNSFKSALVARFAGIPRRTGFRGEARGWLLNDMRRLDEVEMPSLVQRYLALGLDDGPRGSLPASAPRLVPDRANGEAVRIRLGLGTGGLTAALCPGAEFGPAKRWPVRHYAVMAQRLHALGYRIWIMGSRRDAIVAAAIRDAAGIPCDDLCGATDLAEAVDLLGAADVVVSNDSGLMHVAAALDRPMVALFGSSSRQYTPPLSERARPLSLDLPCSPCFQRCCPLGHLRCLQNLTPDMAMAALAEVAPLPH